MTPVEFRRHLHRFPELSFREIKTAEFIRERLTELGIEHCTVAQTGVLCKIEGRGDLKRALVLRADIDALPVLEQVNVPWRSVIPGVMHACGHDVHSAVLYGILQDLVQNPDFEGTLFGLFQPGEECNPGGASLVLAEDPFAGYDVKAVLGLHVEPDFEVGTLGFRAGKYMASSDELRFTVHGTGGHAAMRELLKDPVAAAAELTSALLALNSPERVVSIGRFIADGATNVIPDEVRLEGTLRTFNEEERAAVKAQIKELATKIDDRFKVRTEIDIDHGFPCVINDEKLTELAVRLAAPDHQVEMLGLRTTAEDFGYYCIRYPSLFYRLGVGTTTTRVHTGQFNPDERAITTGIGFMKKLALEIMKKP